MFFVPVADIMVVVSKTAFLIALSKLKDRATCKVGDCLGVKIAQIVLTDKRLAFGRSGGF